jgi:hypothetical protein
MSHVGVERYANDSYHEIVKLFGEIPGSCIKRKVSNDCKDAAKRLACSISSDPCNSDGSSVRVCNDLCKAVEMVCRTSMNSG